MRRARPSSRDASGPGRDAIGGWIVRYRFAARAGEGSAQEIHLAMAGTVKRVAIGPHGEAEQAERAQDATLHILTEQPGPVEQARDSQRERKEQRRGHWESVPRGG